MRHSSDDVLRSLVRSPRFLLVLLLAALLVAGTFATGALHATPTAAEENQAAPEGTVAALPTSRPADLGKPRDPLSIKEIGYATALAAKGVPAGATALDGTRGPELLAVDLASTDSTITTRPVAVEYYDYASDQLVVVTVELYSAKVLDVSSSKKIQPAPSPAEAYEAARLLITSAAGERIRTEYEATVGKPITAGDLTVTGGSYYSTPATKADDACGPNRCVQLQLQGPDGKYLSTAGLVVDLSAGKVLVLAKQDVTDVASLRKAN